uniref:Uncharacterized protein n=1 Tax=Dunaliella tertiolecta TaxID=3047 RepID=A0A7S3R380_DUNTE
MTAATAAAVWERETLMDSYNMSEALECLIITTPIKQQQQQEQFTKEQAAAELGVDVTTLDQPKYLCQAGYRARLGIQAANKKMAVIRETTAAREGPPTTPGGFCGASGAERAGS